MNIRTKNSREEMQTAMQQAVDQIAQVAADFEAKINALNDRKVDAAKAGSAEALYDQAVQSTDPATRLSQVEMKAVLAGHTSLLAVYRKKRGLTQIQLARKAGTSAAYISQIENGATLGLNTAKGLAAALGVLVDDLI